MPNGDQIEAIIKRVLSRNPRKILTKEENYALYEAGHFGNKALTWNSYEEILKSGWKGDVCMRSKRGTARKNVRYKIPLEKVPEEIERWKIMGIPEEMMAFNESMPDEHLLLQGEVMNVKKGLYLLYSTIKKPMNTALSEESREVEGPEAKILLKQGLFPASYFDLELLFQLYPTSVVEFSAYSIPVGNMANKGRNTVFWEVRNY